MNTLMCLLAKLRRLRNNDIFNNSALVGVVQIGTIAIGFLASILLARMLGPKVFGEYQLLLAWLAIGGILSLPGFAVSILKAALKGNDHFFWKALRYSFITSISGALLVGCISLVLFELGLIIYSTSLLIGLVAMGIATTSFQLYDNALIGKRDYRTSRMLALLGASISLVSVTTAAYSTSSAEWVFISYLSSRMIISLYGIQLLKQRMGSTEGDPCFERELIIQGTRQTAVNVFGILVSRLDKIILGAFDPVMLAHYYVGTIIPSQIIANSRSILGVIAAEWGVASPESNIKKITKYSNYFFLLGFLFFVALVFILPLIIPLAFGDAFAPAIEIGQWYSLILLGSFWYVMYLAYNNYQSNGKFAQNIEMVRQLVFVVLLYATFEKFQIKGVIFSLVVSYLIVYCAAFIRFKKKRYG